MESNSNYNSEKEREEKRRTAIINSVLSTCSSLDIYCSVENDFLGVWFDFEGKKYSVEPLELFNTIYDEKDYDGFEYDFLTSYPYDPDDTITVEVHKDNYCYSWRLLYDKNESAISLNFSFQEYINKIKRCFEELHAGWLSGKTLIYDKYDLSLDAIKVALEQLNAVATLPSCYPLHLNPSAFEEEFIFKFNGHIENYSIGIGNRVYSTWLTHWDNSFDKIHHQFESLFYDDEANIELSFDLSNTVIKIKKERIKWIQYEDGKPIQHDLRHMSVEIIPNDFVNMPIIKGFCNRKQTIKILYEGFMRFALRHSFDKPIFDEPKQLDIYNSLKSRLIERMIVYNDLDYYENNIKRIIYITPDSTIVLRDSQGIPVNIDEEGIIEGLYDKQGNPIKIPDLLQWQQEIQPMISDANKGKTFEKDWKNYHCRGFKLARQLRRKLSTDFDLWYDATSVDKSGIIPQPIPIYESVEE